MSRSRGSDLIRGGMLAPWRLMAFIPVGAAVEFVILIKAEVALDSEFFSDPLSILAVPPLAAGELLAYFGSERGVLDDRSSET